MGLINGALKLATNFLDDVTPVAVKAFGTAAKGSVDDVMAKKVVPSLSQAAFGDTSLYNRALTSKMLATAKPNMFDYGYGALNFIGYNSLYNGNLPAVAAFTGLDAAVDVVGGGVTPLLTKAILRNPTINKYANNVLGENITNALPEVAGIASRMGGSMGVSELAYQMSPYGPNNQPSQQDIDDMMLYQMQQSMSPQQQQDALLYGDMMPRQSPNYFGNGGGYQ